MAIRTTAEDWKNKADSYKDMTSDLNVKPIGVMLEGLNARVPFSRTAGVLDDGCGPGPIMARIIEEFGPSIPKSATLVCSDFSSGMVDQANNTKRLAIEANADSLWNQVRTEVLDAMDLKSIEENSLSHVAAGWVFFNVKEPQKALAECKRVLQPGGVLAASSWAETDWLKILKAISKLNPALSPPSIGDDWGKTDNVKAQFVTAGFRDVEVHEVPVDIPFSTYESFVNVMLTRVTQMVAASRGLPEEAKEKLKELMIDEMKELCPTEPGVLKGVSLVALGTK
ncbi:S-adenosyl-L-methionine-dependent methyltransferase [Hypoxylon sp. FL1150]|nr:S-adenosyl-L-methionine-dependent methyltransferase [Hypoxylon sp. FL1150]